MRNRPILLPLDLVLIKLCRWNKKFKPRVINSWPAVPCAKTDWVVFLMKAFVKPWRSELLRRSRRKKRRDSANLFDFTLFDLELYAQVHVFIMKRDNKLLFIASSSCQKGTPSESRPNAGYERCTVYRFSHKLTAKNASLTYLQLASKYLLFWNPPCWGSTFLSRCQFMWLLPFFWG